MSSPWRQQKVSSVGWTGLLACTGKACLGLTCEAQDLKNAFDLRHAPDWYASASRQAHVPGNGNGVDHGITSIITLIEHLQALIKLHCDYAPRTGAT